MPVTLTARQERFMEFIESFRAERGVSPTIREIGKALSIRSPNGVMAHVYALQKKGVLKRGDPMLSRSLVPVVDPERRAALDYLSALPTSRLVSIVAVEREFEAVRRTEGEPAL